MKQLQTTLASLSPSDQILVQNIEEELSLAIQTQIDQILRQQSQKQKAQVEVQISQKNCQETQCKVVLQDECTKETRRDCSEQECVLVEEEKCQLVQDQECQIVDDIEVEEVCENMDKEECRQVPRTVQDRECGLVTKEECRVVVENKCEIVGKKCPTPNVSARLGYSKLERKLNLALPNLQNIIFFLHLLVPTRIQTSLSCFNQYRPL